MVQSVHMQTALMMAKNTTGEENVQHRPHILNQFIYSSQQCLRTPAHCQALNNSPAGTHRSLEVQKLHLSFCSPSIHRWQKFIFSHNFTFYFLRAQFPLTVSVASARLRKCGSCLSNHEMRKMKLMTTHRQLVQEKHKQKLSNNNKKKGTEHYSIKVVPKFSKCRVFSPLMTLWQKESRCATKTKV